MQKYLENDLLIMEFDLQKIKTIHHFLHEVSDFFEFPDYFGENFDVIDECMLDLSWFKNELIEIRFLNLSHLQEKPSLYREIQDMLTFYQEYWQNDNTKAVKIIF